MNSKMRFIRDKFEYLILNIIDFLDLIVFKVIFLFTKKTNQKKPIWLFAEREEDARDNGVMMFEYVTKNYPEIDAYYVISKKAIETLDYERVANIGNLVHRKSMQHKKLFINSSILVSAHFRGSIEPWRERIMKILYSAYYKKKFVFLQHGIIKDDLSRHVDKAVSRFDLFICGAKPEYDYLLRTLEYTEKELKYTGLARYDFLHNIETKNQILLMPTWRRKIACDKINNKMEVFQKTDYFKKYQELINNKKLLDFLEKNNIELVFYLHAEMQKYRKYFTTDSRSVVIASIEEYDIQTLLKESKLLITDYSSVFFDFAYMNKPTIYYQFDEEDFFGSQYDKGYFDYRDNGFGDVVTQKRALLEAIKKVVNNNFEMEEKYKERIKGFFVLHDEKNRERIYNEIIKL